MKKVACIMARGIEGCGVTKFQHEQAKWLEKHDYDYSVFAMADKSYARKYAHDISRIKLVKFANDAEVDKMLEWCNEADYVVVNSLPPREDGRTQPLPHHCYENWARIIKELKPPVVLIQHDHKIYSIRRNAMMDEIIEKAAVIFVHSTSNDFAELVRKQTSAPLDAWFNPNPVNKKHIMSFQPGIDFDDVAWVNIWDQDPLHHKWIGRSTSWKGYDVFFAFYPYLKKLGAVMTLEGIDKSPAFLDFKARFDFHNFVNSKVDLAGQIDLTPYYGDKPVAFSSFTNNGMLDRMSRVGFGYQTSILQPKYIERSIEFTHCEIARAGVVPVFRKEYGDACTHRVTGDPLSKSKDNFTVWINHNNLEECINTIEKLTIDPGLRDEWRNGAYEFYSAHQDSEHVFADLTRKIEFALKHEH